MITKEALTKVWMTTTVNEIASQFGMTNQSVYSAARRFGLPSKMELEDDDDSKPGKDDPTPEQIKERAMAIRKSWSMDEHDRRAIGQRRARYEIPRIATAELFGASEAASYSRI